MHLDLTVIDWPKTWLLLGIAAGVGAAMVFDVAPRLEKIGAGQWLLILLGACIGMSLVTAAAETARDGMFGQTTAAWVQAVGSIAAIVGATAIAFHQTSEQRRSAESAAKLQAFERALEHDAFIDAALHVLARAEVGAASCVQAVQDLDLSGWPKFLGVYQAWTNVSAVFAADLRLLAQRAPHPWLVAELTRSAAVIHLTPIEDLKPAEELFQTLRRGIVSAHKSIPDLMANFEKQRQVPQ